MSVVDGYQPEYHKPMFQVPVGDHTSIAGDGVWEARTILEAAAAAGWVETVLTRTVCGSVDQATG